MSGLLPKDAPYQSGQSIDLMIDGHQVKLNFRSDACMDLHQITETLVHTLYTAETNPPPLET